MVKFELGGDMAKEFAKQWNQRIRSVRISGLVISAIFILLGIICLLSPASTALAMETLISIIIMFFGIYCLVDYFSTSVFFRFGGKLITGIFGLVIGIFLLTSPKENMLSAFSVVIAISLLVSGLEELAYASKLRLFNAEGYSWVICNGILNLCASILFFFMPATSTAALSVFVGVYLLIDGVALLIECINAKDLKFKRTKGSKKSQTPTEIEEGEVVKKTK